MAGNVRTQFTRVWTIENSAGPANVPIYQGRAKAQGVSWDFGDRTPIREPDPSRYGAFKTVGAIKSAQGLPTLPLMVRYQYTASALLALGRRGCDLDLQVHIGECQDPRDFNGGWDKVVVLERANITTYGTEDLGALDQDQDALVHETFDLNGLDYYEILRITLGELAAAEIVQEIVDVAICDAVTCGACGIASDGCSHVFALTMSAGGSPGLPAELIYSIDGGATIGQTNVDTLAANEDPDAMACVGINLVVVSTESCSLHYAPIADILAGTEAWVEVATGFVCAAGAPNDIFSLGSAFTWIVGDGGNVYFSSDITAGVDVQNAGAATTEDLLAIHGFDEVNLVAVGENNAVIMTTNGGATWASVTGPAVGVNLNTVWMRSATEWFVGTAGGRLYYTRDAGATWTEKAFNGSGAGVVRDIVFATPTVGYMAHDTATPLGRILRTIDGGNSWYVLPEGTGSIPDNDPVNALAVSGECPNVVYGGGLGANATDGFLVKGA